jgi:hypothetical protein
MVLQMEKFKGISLALYKQMQDLLSNRYFRIFWNPKGLFNELINNPISWGEISGLFILYGLTNILGHAIQTEKTTDQLLSYIDKYPHSILLMGLIGYWISTWIFSWLLNRFNVTITHKQLASLFAFSQLPKAFSIGFGLMLPDGIKQILLLIGINWAIILFIIALKQIIGGNIFKSIGVYLVFQVILSLVITLLSVPSYSGLYNKIEKVNKKPIWMEPLKIGPEINKGE